MTVVASQDRQRALALGGDEVAPELGDRRLLALGVTRIEPHRAGPQRVHQQAVAAPGPRVEENLPRSVLTLETADADCPVYRVDPLEECRPRHGRGVLWQEQAIRAIEVDEECRLGKPDARKLQAREVKE